MKTPLLVWTVKKLVKEIESGEIDLNCVVQRGTVWESKRKNLSIQSLVESVPFPLFMLVKSGKKYKMIDGKQRGSTFVSFLNNEFPFKFTPSLLSENLDEYKDINKKKYQDFPDKYKDLICDTNINIICLEDVTDEQIIEIFFRWNYGKPLTKIELTRVKIKSNDVVGELENHPIFDCIITSAAKNKHIHTDIVVKGWAILFSDLKAQESKYLAPLLETTEITPEEKDKIVSVLDRLLIIYNLLVSGDNLENKLKVAKIFSKVNLVSIFPIVLKSLEMNVSNDIFLNWITHFFSNEDKVSIIDEYNTTLLRGSSKSVAVKSRLDIIEADFNSFVN